ncbi:family 20 glycosylhydrolase [Streptomyces nogalater]
MRDQPAKPVRGFMLDIARKPFSAAWIEDRIRELGDLKFNELGLHFSDDQAFRIESDSHPEIVSPDHLTKAQVKEIVALAESRHHGRPRDRLPGHLGAALAAHPDLRLRKANGVVTRGAVDISKDASAKLVDDLLNEYAGLFTGGQWHLGGDEYQALMARDPQTSYPQLAAAARRKYGPGGTVADLTTGWLDDRAATVRAHGRTVRAWNDGFFRGTSVQPDPSLQVAYWTGKEIGARPPPEYLSATGRCSTTTTSSSTTCSASRRPSSTRPGSGSTSSGPRGWCAARPPCPRATTGRSSAGRSPCGATSRARRRRSRSPPASGCRCGPPCRSCGTRAHPPCPGRTSGNWRTGWAEDVRGPPARGASAPRAGGPVTFVRWTWGGPAAVGETFGETGRNPVTRPRPGPLFPM